MRSLEHADHNSHPSFARLPNASKRQTPIANVPSIKSDPRLARLAVARPFVALLTLLILLALAISVVHTSVATHPAPAIPELPRSHSSLRFRGGGVFVVTLPAAGELEGHS